MGSCIIYGALFGLITYATYDLTNLATLKDWPVIVTVVDLIWGTVLASAISVITYLISYKNIDQAETVPCREFKRI